MSDTKHRVLQSKDFLEGDPELPGHGTIEDEVDGAVRKSHHVHQLTEGSITVDEKLVAEKARKNTKNALKIIIHH